jgi:hypothetical protein
MAFRRFGYAELVAAFRALDRTATDKRQVIVFGGAAIALYTRTSSGTSDVDYGGQRLDDLVTSCRAQGLDLPAFSMPTIADFPYQYEDRLHHILPDLERLEVLVPEIHDLALSKVVRWFEGDEIDVKELHHSCKLSRRVLVERYLDEMTHVMGDRRRIDANFCECIEALFGEIAADDAREAVTRRS